MVWSILLFIAYLSLIVLGFLLNMIAYKLIESKEKYKVVLSVFCLTISQIGCLLWGFYLTDVIKYLF